MNCTARRHCLRRLRRLPQMLKLNQSVAACMEASETVTAPGIPPGYPDPANSSPPWSASPSGSRSGSRSGSLCQMPKGRMWVGRPAEAGFTEYFIFIFHRLKAVADRDETHLRRKKISTAFLSHRLQAVDHLATSFIRAGFSRLCLGSCTLAENHRRIFGNLCHKVLTVPARCVQLILISIGGLMRILKIAPLRHPPGLLREQRKVLRNSEGFATLTPVFSP